MCSKISLWRGSDAPAERKRKSSRSMLASVARALKRCPDIPSEENVKLETTLSVPLHATCAALVWIAFCRAYVLRDAGRFPVASPRTLRALYLRAPTGACGAHRQSKTKRIGEDPTVVSGHATPLNFVCVHVRVAWTISDKTCPGFGSHKCTTLR